MKKIIFILLIISFGCNNEKTTKPEQNIQQNSKKNELERLAKRSDKLMRDGRYANAIPLLTDYIKREKKAKREIYNSFTYYQRGQCKYYVGDYHGALEDLKKAEQLDEIATGSVDANYFVYLAKTYLKLKNFDEACRYLRLSGESGNDKAYELISKYCN